MNKPSFAHLCGMRRVIIFILLLFTKSVWSQTGTTAPISDTLKFNRYMQIALLPVVGYNPSTGFLVGVAATQTWFMGRKETTRMSSAQIAGLYTSKNQKMFTLKSNAYLKDDSWDLIGDWRLFFSSAPTFGLGTGPQSAKPVAEGVEYETGQFSAPIPDEQMMLFNYIRIHEIFLKRYKNHLYFGLGYHLDYHFGIDDKLLDTSTTAGHLPVLTSHYLYSNLNQFSDKAYTLSGVSLNALFDSRDNAVNPYKGRYAHISYKINPTQLGSNQSSTQLWIEYRDYLNLDKARPRHLLAFWTFANLVTSGRLPYMDLPAQGWDQYGRSGRAYIQGRFRGNQLLYGETEYRFPLQRNNETWGGVIFVNATTASNDAAGIGLFKYVDPAAGIGLRFMMKKESRVNITCDYGVGKYGSSGFFFNLNETF